ncbi:MAG: PKD domain-containing protein [Candidatus Peribacteraceae bacterium]|nr:PKD domain-containing protein [Candidatus Peribacteraceae bacterium]
MDQPKPVDGITQAPSDAPEQQVPPAPAPQAGKAAQDIPEVQRRRMKVLLLVFFGIPYMAFLGWCFFLMAVLPDPTGGYETLIPIGSAVAMGGAAALLLLGGMATMRILRKKGDLLPPQLAMSVLRVVLVLAPGIAIGAMTPFIISAEPRLWMTVTEPASTVQMVAPVAVTFSVESAAEILRRRGVQPIAYHWDFNGDGQEDELTVVPTATAFYSRRNLYNVAVGIETSDGKPRKVSYRLSIEKEVFQITPMQPIVDEPVKFSVAHMVDLPEEVKEVQWDFESDGTVDIVTSDLEVVHTFVRTGPKMVSAVIIKQNQSQQKLEREISVSNPAPLPFDVRIVSEPSMLVSPPPFQTIFRIQTEEPVREVKWDFGDGEERDGERVGHTFTKKGNYMVTVNVKSESGDVAKLTKLVRVVDQLNIPDLTFSGTPSVDLKSRIITGEVPLTLNLTPRSSLPLLEYHWEAPDATSVGSTETTLQAIYRRPDTYTVILLAEDASGHAMRLPIRVEVKPPAKQISILMEPEGGVAPLEVAFDASDTRIPNENIAGFEWYFGEELEGERPKPGSAVMRYTYTKPGTYTVRLLARTSEGNVHEASRTIVVRPPLLDACFTASRIRGTAPLGVKFTMSCTTGTPSEITWNFGDGASTDERDPIHSFDDPGTYTVKLSIKDASGNVSDATLTITADAP